MLRKLPLLIVVALASLAVVVTAVAAPAREQKTLVTVTATEFKFVLSKKIVPKGIVAFRVVNKGKLPHDFKIAGKKSARIGAGKTTTLVVTFKKIGKFPYLCTVPGHAAAGMKGSLTVR
jgi:uncharacterized cupredoxin-like copper-binding protein